MHLTQRLGTPTCSTCPPNSVILLTPVSSSSLLPISVMSSAKSDRLILTLTASYLYFSLRPASGSLSQGNPSPFDSDLHVPSLCHLNSTSLCYFITAWWYTLQRTGDICLPSLRPHSGGHSSLSPSFLLTFYAVVSWGLVLSRGIFLQGHTSVIFPIGLVYLSIISSCILTIICVISTVNIPCLKHFW